MREVTPYEAVVYQYMLGIGDVARICRRYPLAYRVARLMVGREAYKIRQGICPWCGHRFRRIGIIRHLTVSGNYRRCWAAFNLTVRYVARVACVVRSAVRTSKYRYRRALNDDNYLLALIEKAEKGELG